MVGPRRIAGVRGPRGGRRCAIARQWCNHVTAEGVEAGNTDAITFLLEEGEDVASFTVGSKGFKLATIEEYGLDIRILNVRMFISLPNGAEPYPV